MLCREVLSIYHDMVGSVGNISNKREVLPMIQDIMGNVPVFIVMQILQNMVGSAVNVKVLPKISEYCEKVAIFS